MTSSNGSGAADSGGEAPANTVQVGGWTLSADLSPEAMAQVQGLISGMQNSGPARQAVENLRLSGDVCAAVGGRVWRVVDCSAVGDVADVRKALLKMVANGQKPMGILAP